MTGYSVDSDGLCSDSSGGGSSSMSTGTLIGIILVTIIGVAVLLILAYYGYQKMVSDKKKIKHTQVEVLEGPHDVNRGSSRLQDATDQKPLKGMYEDFKNEVDRMVEQPNDQQQDYNQQHEYDQQEQPYDQQQEYEQPPNAPMYQYANEWQPVKEPQYFNQPQ